MKLRIVQNKNILVGFTRLSINDIEKWLPSHLKVYVVNI